jgi:hypothetical protein
MAEFDAERTTTTGMNDLSLDFKVPAETLDQSELSENKYDFPDAGDNWGYYKQIPELKKAVDTLAIWVVGKGITTNTRTQKVLERVRGWGEDSYQAIFFNQVVTAKVQGDSFAQIIRDEFGELLNLKPLDPNNMTIVTDKKGIIKRYENRVTGNEPQKLQPKEIFHICNDRVGNEIHGTPIIDACKWVIDARNEAMDTERKVRRRQLALGVLKIDSDDATEIAAVTTKYQNAITNGEVLVLPKGVADLEDSAVTPQNNLEWIKYLENAFYQAVGIPRVIASSQEYSEASSKIGYLTFEPIYTREQVELELDILTQLGLTLKFNRPPSLGGFIQESEEKNTGQTGVQANEVQANIGRSE